MKIFFEKMSNIFGLNLANFGSFYDRLLCLGPLPGTLFLTWSLSELKPRQLDPSLIFNLPKFANSVS